MWPPPWALRPRLTSCIAKLSEYKLTSFAVLHVARERLFLRAREAIMLIGIAFPREEIDQQYSSFLFLRGLIQF